MGKRWRFVFYGSVTLLEKKVALYDKIILCDFESVGIWR